MSTFWIHSSGTVAVDDAVMKGVDVSGFPSNLQLMMWYGSYGELRYKDDDRLPIRERVANLAAFVHIFDRWLLAANTPLPTESGRASPPIITLAQAQYVKGQLVWGLYYNKSQPSTPGAAPPDNTNSVNAAVQGLVDSVNSSLATLSAQINTVTENYALSNTGARSADAGALNASLNSQNEGHTANISIANTNFGALSSLNIPSGGGALPPMGGLGGVAPGNMPTTHVEPGQVSAPGVSTSGVTPGGAAGPHDTLAPIRDAHLSNVYAQGSVAAVAAYDITAGW